jgi:phage-related protein
LASRVFVLHASKKKSKSGIATSKADIDLITQRLKQAVALVGRRRYWPPGASSRNRQL